MKKRLLFPLYIFLFTVVFMAVQKFIFLLYYFAQASEFSFGAWCRVVWHGLPLDVTVSGYITLLPLLLTIASLWVQLSDRTWQRILNIYFVVISIVASAIFAVDLGLYGYWGFRLDGMILGYLSQPSEAMASVGMWEALRQILFLLLCAAVMIGGYRWVVRHFSVEHLCGWLRTVATGLLVLLCGVLFIAIRGGLTVATANISKVYFSSEMFLNHAATNPIFSFLSSIGDNEAYESQYPFFDESTRAANFDRLRGNGHAELSDSVRLLRVERPNVVVVILESFGRTVMDVDVDGVAVMPYMQRYKKEGVWFENFFANSFRTDRGEVAILSGFPAQTGISIMKLPGKSHSLPSIARSLGREGYATSFMYGGDLNFTDQASYMYATGWQRLTWQKDMHFDAPTSKWGYADDVVTDYFADEVLRLDAAKVPFLAGLLTLSSHEPFDVPFSHFDDKVLNAMAFTDDCVGRMIERWRQSPAWDNLVVVLVADHGYNYPKGLEYNSVLRHRIPMVWVGGAIEKGVSVDAYASQIDLAATLLAQLGISHDDFDYSKDIFDSRVPKFGYYVFEDGFGVIDPNGAAIYDCISSSVLDAGNPALLDVGRTMLQTTYVDIGRR